MSIAPFNYHSSSTFHDYNILKFWNIINIEGRALIINCFSSNLFQYFLKDFNLYQDLMLKTLDHPVKTYFLFLAIILHDILKWNHLQNTCSNHDFMKLVRKILKNFLTQKLISLPIL